MDTISVGSEIYRSASWERCTRPFSLIPISTKAPKLVMLPTMPGSNHSFAQVVDRTYVLIKFEYLNGFTRVTSRFVEFLQDVL